MNLTKHLAGLLGAAASLGAAAAPQAAANGVMEFPHVRVAAQAPPAQAAPEPAPQRGGFMAFKDPVTGKLVGPSPQQSSALTGPPRGAATAGATPKPSVTRPPHGGVAMMLDDSHQRYAVARKDADGHLAESCQPDATLGEHHEK